MSIKDIGVAYALVGISSLSVVVVDDMVGVGGSNAASKTDDYVEVG